MTYILKSNYFLLCFSLFLLFSCQNEEVVEPYTMKDGIFIETLFENETDDNRYTADNTIFIADKEYIYSYYFLSANKDTLKCNPQFNQEAIDENVNKIWSLTSTKDTTPYFDKISWKVIEGRKPFVKHIPDYFQSVVQVQFYDQYDKKLGGLTTTGMIDNIKNVWLPNPSIKMFSILQLNPNPFVLLPLEKGKTWDLSRIVGEGWADERWATWEGKLANNITYTVEDTNTTINTPLGQLSCGVVKAIAKNSEGNTALTIFFHPKYGFVRLIYDNIDNSMITFDLVEVK